MNKEMERGLNWNVIIFLMMIFLFGGIIGFIYEELFYYIELGYFVKRGTTMGPWIPIYGFGCVFILLATEKIKKKPLKVFALAACVSGLLEFATGYILYHFVGGLRLWDYNVEIWNWLNIGGYVCLRSLLVFGVAGLIVQYVASPVFHKMTYDEKFRHIKYILIAGFVLFVIDILFVSCAGFLK